MHNWQYLHSWLNTAWYPNPALQYHAKTNNSVKFINAQFSPWCMVLREKCDNTQTLDGMLSVLGLPPTKIMQIVYTGVADLKAIYCDLSYWQPCSLLVFTGANEIDVPDDKIVKISCTHPDLLICKQQKRLAYNKLCFLRDKIANQKIKL